jgi:hypothetical protein
MFPVAVRSARRGALRATALALAAAAAAAQVPDAAEPVPRLLREIAAKADPDRNYLLNQRRVELFRARLAAESDPVEALILRSHLVVELVRAGLSREALAEIEGIRGEAGRIGVPADAPVLRALREWSAVAYLRLAEQENCLPSGTGEACLMPIRGGGRHSLGEGSRGAIAEFTALLEADPDDLGYRWLLNLAYMTLGEHPGEVPERWLIPEAVFASEYALPRFPEVAQRAGVDASGLAGGSLLEDFDLDGDLDLLVSSWGLEDPLRYFRNRGDGSFEDASAGAGLDGQLGGLNLVSGDADGDGLVDVLVLRGGWLGFVGQGQGSHPNSLLRNRGDGSFEDVTRRSGLLGFHPTQTAAWADYDLDGDLDLFVGNESTGGDVHPCQLFENDGAGSFADVAPEVGLDHTGFVKGVAWGDVDDDGLPDLYLSRFGQPNLLFRNEGGSPEGWRFRDVTATAGVAEPLLSFATWFWDYDDDGHEDLLVASFASYSDGKLAAVVADYLGLGVVEHPRLFRNRGDGTFSDVSREAGLDVALMAMGAGFGDLDGDGWLDAYFGTGQPSLMTLIPNRMFRNDRGERFQDVTTAGGFGHLQKGHAISFGDVDGDGDQDVYAVMGGAYSGDVFRNALFENPGNGSRWLKLRLVGERSNPTAVGARVRVVVEEGSRLRELHRTVSSGGSFGASSVRLEIGLGAATAVRSVSVTWPRPGRPVQVFRDVPLDSVIELRESVSGP